MKKLILMLLFVSTVMCCTTNNNRAQKNITLIENYIQAVEDLDYKTMESMLDDNYMGHGPSYNDSIGKMQIIKNWKQNVEHLYQSIDYNKSRNIATYVESGENQGEWVSNWAELHIVYKKDKASVTIWTNNLYQIKNNKILKSYTFYNEADVLEQLGFVFINPNDI